MRTPEAAAESFRDLDFHDDTCVAIRILPPQRRGETNLSAVEIELLPGEEDRANVAYIEKLGSAWACTQEHDLFRDIQGAKPAGITANANESGTQSPFDLKSYRAALKTAGQSYTAGINLFWIGLMWSATPGAPLRVSAIELMAKTMSTSTLQSDIYAFTFGGGCPVCCL